jgi:hypothetical protein
LSIPGVPNVPPFVNLISSIALIVADAINFLTGFGTPEWGIFQDGVSVVTADSVVSMGYKQNWAISTYAIEQGGFQTYNKVDTPYSARVRFASGGSQEDRQALLDSIAAIAGTTELYDVVTPEQVYTNANIQSFDYQRTSVNGVGLIQVDVQLIEVRETAVASFVNTKSPTAQAAINDGTVQTGIVADANVNAVKASGITVRPVQ